jgi:hypothetical protein
MDGANEFGILWYIMLPLIKGADRGGVVHLPGHLE